MADVLLSYLQTRNPIDGDRKPASGAEPASWTVPAGHPGTGHSGAEPDRVVKSTLPYPLSGLFALVDSYQDYPDSSKELAGFLKNLCGRHPLEELMLQVVQARFPRVWMERFLFILLEVQPSDWQTAAYVLQFRHLKRLLLRVERKTPLNAVESGLARELISALCLTRFLDFDPYCRHAGDTFRTVQAGRIPVMGDVGLLVYLIRSECTAMGERRNWLESDPGAGDPDSVARLSPHLKLLEERIHNAQQLAERIGAHGPIQDAPMGLEEAMGPFFFSHLKECLLKSPSLAGLRETLELQQTKRVPTRDLIALSTLSRWLMEARGAPASPLEWVRMALEAYHRGHFRLDMAGGLPAVEVLLSEAKVEREGTLVLGNFGENPYAPWIARDGLTRPFRSSNPDRIGPDLLSLVISNLHRDNILLKLLDNVKVYGTPGLVEVIVEGSRSPRIHAKIAGNRELHTGSANGRVVVALLRSQVSIPASLLRSLIHPSIVAFSEVKLLYRGRSALRHDVVEELHHFLLQAYAV